MLSLFSYLTMSYINKSPRVDTQNPPAYEPYERHKKNDPASKGSSLNYMIFFTSIKLTIIWVS